MHALSINARGKQEMLDDWHDLDLAEIEEELVEFLLVGAVKDQVWPENEDASSQDWQNFKRLKANDPVKQKVDLIDF